MSANCKANGLFWVAVIMLVVELLFALLLNQVLVTMVSQTKYSKQEEKVARWWLRCRTFWHNTIGLVVIVLYECRKKWWVISLIVLYFFMPIHTGENLGKCFFVATRVKPGALWVLWHLSTGNVDHVSGMVRGGFRECVQLRNWGQLTWGWVNLMLAPY